jgi:hypothetical protein
MNATKADLLARPVDWRGLVLPPIAGLFFCFALRELRIGKPEIFWVRLPYLMLFPWLVFAVAIWRTARSSVAATVQRVDLAIVLCIAFATIPFAAERGIGLCAGAIGALIFWRLPNDADMRAAAICLLALCANFSIAPLIFRLAYASIIGADIALLQTAINWSGAPVTVTPAGMIADDGLRVTLVGACSSFAGISSAILVHMGWAMVIRSHVGWRDGIAVAATVCVATALNIIRLTMTASGHAEYAFWHGAAGETPLGSQIFWFAQNAVLLTGGYLSAYWAGITDTSLRTHT